MHVCEGLELLTQEHYFDAIVYLHPLLDVPPQGLNEPMFKELSVYVRVVFLGISCCLEKQLDKRDYAGALDQAWKLAALTVASYECIDPLYKLLQETWSQRCKSLESAPAFANSSVPTLAKITRTYTTGKPPQQIHLREPDTCNNGITEVALMARLAKAMTNVYNSTVLEELRWTLADGL